MTPNPKRFGPFIGGCVGGTLGYAAGAAFGPVAAVGMFFLGAYVGYDFKTAGKIFGRARTSLITRVQAHGPKLVDEARNLLRAVKKYWYVYAVWAAVTALCFNFVIGDSAMHQLNRVDEYESPFTPRLHLPYTVDVLQTVITGESRYFPKDGSSVVPPRLDAFLVIVVSGAISGVCGIMLLFILAMLRFALVILTIQLVKGTVAVLKTYKQWPLTLAWILFWVLALPTIGPAWVVAASLSWMYTVRRFACGAVTVATGMGYLLFVPVPTSPELIGAAAIGCGLSCGLSAHGLFALVGHPAVMERLRALRERTIASFAPLPTLPWWNARRSKRALAVLDHVSA